MTGYWLADAMTILILLATVGGFGFGAWKIIDQEEEREEWSSSGVTTLVGGGFLFALWALLVWGFVFSGGAA